LKGAVSTLGILGALAGLVTAAIALMADVAGLFAVAGDPATRISIALILAALSALALLAALFFEPHPGLARSAFLLTGALGFLFGALLWLPAGTLLVLAGLSRQAVCRPRASYLSDDGDEFYPSC
jgi:hypothetical protein